MGSEARARLGLAGLLAISLFSFNQVFATGDYPGPALLGILIAVALVMVGRRLGVGSILTIVGSLVAMVAYLCLVFQADKTFRGLPSPRSLQGLWRSLEHAYSQSQVDFAPVPPRPGYVVLVVAGLWIAALIGEMAAFRWRRPLLASLPCIGLFALIMVVGTGEAAPLLVALFLIALFAFWGLESSHRLRAWGRWVPTWKEHESEPEPTEVTGTLARRMGAACVLMGMVVPLFLPALGDGLLVWRNPTGEGLPGGGGEGGALDPLVSVRPQLIDQPETVLFEVTSLRPSYWRLLTYTQFDGVSWHGSSEADRPSQFGAISTDVDPGTVTRTVTARFVMRALEGERLPTTGLPRQLDFTGSNADEYESGLTYDAENGDVEMEQRIIDGLRYEVGAVLPEASFRNLSRAAPGEIEDPTYRQIPTDLSNVVFQTANEWTEGIDNPFRQLVAIQNRLRGFDYSLNVEDTGSDDYLGDFLSITRRGFCQQFASAFAILARLKGFSTRVVVGFLPGSTTLSAPTTYSVRGTHAHVWPEVYLQGYGWVPFEPTPRAPAPPPAYTVPGLSFGSAPRPDFQIADAGQNQDLQGAAARLAREPINPGGIEQQAPVGNRVNLEWKKTFTRIALFVTILTLAYLVVTPAWKLRRIQARYRRARGSRAKAAAAFAHFQEEAGDLVSRRAPAESATAYATRLSTLRKVPARSALRLASIYEASEYAPTDTSEKEASEAKDLARQLRASIWGGASWWDRGQRLFSPAWNGRKVAWGRLGPTG
jgi:transglutaminase-like putative cysteine protease